MKTLAKFIACVTLGAVGHLTHYPIKRLEAGANRTAWYRLARYVIGLVMIRFGLIVSIDDPKTRKEAVAAFDGVAIAVGGGVALGYALDGMR